MNSDYVLAAGVLASILWSAVREASFRSFKLKHLDFQRQSICDNQEMIRHVTQCLADVTSILGTTVRAVESSTGITKEIKSELLANFNQTETRIMGMLQRIEQQAIHIYNTQAYGGQTNQGKNVNGNQQ